MTHPIRLGLALNYAVFLYDVIGDIDEGYKIARRAFDMAHPTFKDVLAHGDNDAPGADDSSKEAVRIMRSLADKLHLWQRWAKRYCLTYKRRERMALMPAYRSCHMREDGINA